MTEHTQRNYGTWAAMGASISAVLSSACCWIPLLLLAFGASAAGVSGFFEAYRVYLLGATGVLLATGFYLVYFRKPHCAPGGACTVPNSKLTRFNKGMLWVATVFVTGFAFFPNYVGALVGARHNTTTVEGPMISMDVQGMTCEACALHIEKELRGVPGVRDARVIYAEHRATVTVDASSPPQEAALLGAVERAGYKATVGVQQKNVKSPGCCAEQ
jgi:copper chaperone CopZ